jgi:hypothetical protein
MLPVLRGNGIFAAESSKGSGRGLIGGWAVEKPVGLFKKGAGSCKIRPAPAS